MATGEGGSTIISWSVKNFDSGYNILWTANDTVVTNLQS